MEAAKKRGFNKVFEYEDRFFDLWAVVFQLWFGQENKHYSMDSTFEGF